MTREEEIIARAEEAENETTFSDIVLKAKGVNSAYGIGFLEGAKWADEHHKEGMVSIEKVKEFLSSVDLNFYREWEDKFNTDELIVDLERYLESKL